MPLWKLEGAQLRHVKDQRLSETVVRLTDESSAGLSATSIPCEGKICTTNALHFLWFYVYLKVWHLWRNVFWSVAGSWSPDTKMLQVACVVFWAQITVCCWRSGSVSERRRRVSRLHILLLITKEMNRCCDWKPEGLAPSSQVGKGRITIAVCLPYETV